MERKELDRILDNHKAWLDNLFNGKQANLRNANLEDANLRDENLSCAELSHADLSRVNLNGVNLRRADLTDANLSCADLINADLRNADLRNANLEDANLRDANLSYAELSHADLSRVNLNGVNLSYTKLSGTNLEDANLRNANLSCANLSHADLRNADLIDADLRKTNLSGAKGLLSAIDYLKDNFERTNEGYIAYKTFNGTYEINSNWKIEEGSVISENVNFNRCEVCGCGINVATLDWVKEHYEGDIWKVLIRWEWLCGVCVPYMTDGKIRCERVELVEIVERI